MIFRSAAEVAFDEMDSRISLHEKLLTFGVRFLDDAMIGILPNDLILVGASSGAGKTQFCCNMALANVRLGKTVHYIALEADEFEIDRRIKFQIIAHRYFADPHRPKFDTGLHYPRWLLGMYGDELAKYEDEAAKEIYERYKKLFFGYKSNKFGVSELIESVVRNAGVTDLIIVDHVHYFDFDDKDTEQKAIAEIAKVSRTLALEQGKPIVLVAHLRKKDKFNHELVPAIEEFHGSSDLYKIATKAITFSPGAATTQGNYETFFRIGKNRVDGGVTRYLGRTIFAPQKGTYEPQYKIGLADQKRRDPTDDNPSVFTELDNNLWPFWVDRQTVLGGSSYHHAPQIPNLAEGIKRRKDPYADN